MKNILIILLASFGSLVTQAQNASNLGSASIDEHFIISLPTETSLAENYIFSIAHLNIKDENVCDMLFQNLSESIAMYKADFANQSVTISLSYNSFNQNWKLEDWNSYFAQRGKKMEAYYLHISK